MGWYVLHVGPRSEKKVAETCERHGVPHYLPLRSDRRVYQRRKVVILKPLFPGYLFVDMTLETRVHVMRTNHVLQWIVPPDEDQLMYELAQIRLALAANPTLTSDVRLCRGARVKIKGGVFIGVEGVVDAHKSDAVVRLNVEMVGQSVGVDVDRDYLALL